MEQYEYIRSGSRVYGKSIRGLVRETGHARNTVRKVLKGEYQGYSQRQQQPYPVLGPYLGIIDKWLEEDKDRPKKQRHTAKRIFDRLRTEHGYKGGKSTVRRYVCEAKRRIGVSPPRAFIPLDPECAKEAEVDWGTMTAKIKGVFIRFKFFCMRSKYSGKHFVRCYPCERQQVFFEAHMQAFLFFGGVFTVLIYDNLTTAVQKILRGKDRLEQASFVKFRAYYSFTARFCNPDSPHEKGGVEGMVGYVRRNYMVPVPEADSLEELNQMLLAQCLSYGEHRIDGREGTVNELFEAEKERLLPLPEVPFSNIQIMQVKVSCYATVMVEKNRYSVPTLYVGLRVSVELSAELIAVFYSGKKIAAHSRVYGSNKWCLDPQHYLDLIKQRPASFDAARPIRAWRENWPPVLERLLEKFNSLYGQTDGIKAFIDVLLLYRDYPSSDVEAAVELALEHHAHSADGVKQILEHCEPDSHPAPLEGWPETAVHDLSLYGQLGGVR